MSRIFSQTFHHLKPPRRVHAGDLSLLTHSRLLNKRKDCCCCDCVVVAVFLSLVARKGEMMPKVIRHLCHLRKILILISTIGNLCRIKIAAAAHYQFIIIFGFIETYSLVVVPLFSFFEALGVHMLQSFNKM